MEYNLFDPFPRHVEAILIAELEKDLLDPNIVYMPLRSDRHLTATLPPASVADATWILRYSASMQVRIVTLNLTTFTPWKAAISYQQQCSQEDVLDLLAHVRDYLMHVLRPTKKLKVSNRKLRRNTLAWSLHFSYCKAASGAGR